jgi:hypothetical protein
LKPIVEGSLEGLLASTNTTLKFQDLNNNSWPDVGETSLVLGKLYAPNTQNEIGTYRASFIWGNWANFTDSFLWERKLFDIKDNGMGCCSRRYSH